VRLCYSTQAQLENAVILRDAVEANLEFEGKRYLEVLDATVDAITQAGLMVIINNHNHKSGWCCHYTQDEGLWYTSEYPESVWIDSLVQMTLRYKSNPLVVAIDLRNEVHDYQDTVVTWGTNDMKTDWAAAATRAGNAVLAANPNVLIVIMALCFGMDLRAARDYPISLTVPDRVVYQTHNYVEFQFWSWVSTTVTSWASIRDFSAVVWIVALVCAVVLWLAWDELRRPKPTLNSLLVYAGIWFFAILALSAVIAFVMYSVTRPYCGYWARRDMLPAVIACGLLSPIGLAMIVGGCVRHCRGCDACRTVAPTGETKETSSSSSSEEARADKEGALPIDNPTPTASPEELALSPRSNDNIEAGEPQPEVRRASAPKRLLGAPGCRSCGLAWSGLVHKVQKRNKGTKAELEVEWDMGLCCGFNCFVLAIVLLLALGVLFIFACFAPTYQLLETHFDRMWGFVQEEGHPYTAPVWMGEFGNPVRGTYWINFMRYLRDRDMDFAYWALNGKKWGEGWIDTTTGKWYDHHGGPRWENESFGIFKEDYFTVRDAWRLLDLQALMMPPVDHFRVMEPCDRAALGSQCGG
jgi:ferredoxin